MNNENVSISENRLRLDAESHPSSQLLLVVSQKDLEITFQNVVNEVIDKIPTSIPAPNNSDQSKKILMLKQAAEYIQMPVPTFREYLARNEIKGAKIGKSWRFFPEDLDDFVKKHLRKTNDEIEKEIDDELSK